MIIAKPHLQYVCCVQRAVCSVLCTQLIMKSVRLFFQLCYCTRIRAHVQLLALTLSHSIYNAFSRKSKYAFFCFLEKYLTCEIYNRTNIQNSEYCSRVESGNQSSIHSILPQYSKDEHSFGGASVYFCFYFCFVPTRENP